MKRDALLSLDSRYRYRLYREWGDGPQVLWVMLNPSTADALADDPTIRRCIAFSKAWGYGSLAVGNVYAFRATDPGALWVRAIEDARGPGNVAHLRDMAECAARVVCAWGALGSAYPDLLDALGGCSGGLWCLGTTKNGRPRHPLYVRGDTPLVEWRPSSTKDQQEGAHRA